jgi:sterol 3beta-glucosyltransferase
MFDQVFWRAISGQINRWRRDYLGIGPTNLDKMMQHKVPFLYNFSPSLVPPPLDWVEWIRVTGLLATTINEVISYWALQGTGS